MGQDVKINVNLDPKGVKKGSQEVVKSAEEMNEALGKTAKTAGVAFAAFGAGIGVAVKQAGDLEQISTKFEVLTGSVEESEKTIKSLTDFTARTPFQLEGVSNTAAQLLSFGVAGEDLLPTLQSIGDVAAAVGTPLQDLGLIFGQVRAAGKLTGERLLQLQERAIPIGAELAKVLNVTEAEVKDLVSKGVVDFATFEKAFENLSKEGGIAFGGIQKQSETLGGVLSTLGDNFSLLAADIGKQFLPFVKEAAKGLIDFIGQIRENEELAKFGAIILAAGAAISGLVAGLATLGLAIPAITAGLGTIATVLGAISLPITLTVAAVAGLAFGFIKYFDVIKSASIAFANVIGGIFSNIGKLFSAIIKFDPAAAKEAFSQLKDSIATGAEDIGAEFERIEEERIAKEEERLEADRERRQAEEEKRQEEEQQRLIKKQELNEQESAQEKMHQDVLKQIKADADKQEQKRQAEFIKNQIRFGRTIAEVDKLLQSERVQGIKQGTSELTQLTQSRNSTLKGIGKAATVTQIGINTAESASNIYKGFSAIPIVGPALGIAAAAAAIAFGAEQTAQVLKAQSGGIVPQIFPGLGDRQPALLEAGETVVPRQNFDELINSVANQRITQGDLDEGEDRPPQMVEIGFNGDEAEKVLTSSQNEARALGISEEIA